MRNLAGATTIRFLTRQGHCERMEDSSQSRRLYAAAHAIAPVSFGLVSIIKTGRVNPLVLATICLVAGLLYCDALRRSAKPVNMKARQDHLNLSARLKVYDPSGPYYWLARFSALAMMLVSPIIYLWFGTRTSFVGSTLLFSILNIIFAVKSPKHLIDLSGDRRSSWIKMSLWCFAVLAFVLIIPFQGPPLSVLRGVLFTFGVGTMASAVIFTLRKRIHGMLPPVI